MLGSTIGSYRVVRELGRGGMGVVYEAEHVTLGSRAAVKVLLPRFSEDHKLVARFFNEARAASRIKHPGIVTVFDFGHQPSGPAYLVMELLEGETLSTRRKRTGRLAVRQALVTARQIASALDAAHAAGIVHRDLKPHNLFLVRDPDVPAGERIKGLDFGIAKLAGDLAPAGPETAEGSVLGTPKYMSPEQCRGAINVDVRSDVYSLGCILFEMICGEPPFTGANSADIIARQMFEPPPRPSSRVMGLAADVELLISRCLEKQPERRPASMAELASALDELARTAVDQALADTPEPLEPTRAPTQGTMTATPVPVPVPADVAAPRVEPTPVKPRRRRRSPVPIGLAVAALVGIAVAVVAMTAPPRRGAPPPIVAPQLVSSVADAAVLSDGADGPSDADVALATVKLKLTSDPSGAAVLRAADEAWLGQTPIAIPMARAQGSAEFVLRLKGYAEERVSLRIDANAQQHVVLHRNPPAASPAAKKPEPVREPTPPAKDIGDGFLDPFGSGAKP